MQKEAIEIQKLLAISILDGRNREKVGEVANYFSEYALIKYRLYIEIEYLIFLSKNTNIFPKLKSKELLILKQIISQFSPQEALKIKEIELVINHDVKAVEYYLQKKFNQNKLPNLIPFIHIGLTSYDINIPSYALMIKNFHKLILQKKLNSLITHLKELINISQDMPMLGRTHGQPALPTTMGKEIAVFYQRLKNEIKVLNSISLEAKLNGAIGNFNSLVFTYPEYNWIDLSSKFITFLGLTPNIVTTQILPYDSWLRYFDSLKRVNNILIGFTQDMWWYISFEYFLQKKKENEVGSSTMSHKINPITFENAEGNLQLANSLFEFFVRKLSTTRLQRDLTDSTIKRDFGLAFGFTLLAWDSIMNGLSRIMVNPIKMKFDLENHWEVFSEGIQTYLRAKGHSEAYELMKEKTRGKTFTKEEFHQLIEELPIDFQDKKRLKIGSLTEYLGLAKKIVMIVIGK